MERREVCSVWSLQCGGKPIRQHWKFFTASEASVATGAMFYEMYLAQTVNLPWNDTFKVRLGRMSMGDTFCSLPAFGYLVSGGIDANPEALFANSPFTASTIATWGITAQYNTIENLSFAAGLYQVPPNINSSGWDGTNFTINSDDGYMMLFRPHGLRRYLAKIAGCPEFIRLAVIFTADTKFKNLIQRARAGMPTDFIYRGSKLCG